MVGFPGGCIGLSSVSNLSAFGCGGAAGVLTAALVASRSKPLNFGKVLPSGVVRF
jgi:hypothetical protein